MAPSSPSATATPATLTGLTPATQALTCDRAVHPRVLPRDEAERRAALMKAASDPVRLQLISIIRDSPDSTACVCDMTDSVEVSQPTVSHHLKVLTDAGLITRERRGTWAWFTLVPDRLSELAGYFA